MVDVDHSLHSSDSETVVGSMCCGKNDKCYECIR